MSESIFIHPGEARRQFREFATGEIATADLARGALLIALEDYPRLDIESYLRVLDDLAERVHRRRAPGERPVLTLGHLHAEMFDVDGYRGDTDSYYDPRNAYLNGVVDRKRGIPITLSIVFLHAATRLGLNAAGVGLPGHYVVKIAFELNEVYVDTFHGGTMLTSAELAELVSGATGGRSHLSPEHLRAWTARQTLTRVLANLVNMWQRAGEPRKAQAAQERMLLLDAAAQAG